MRFTIPLSHNMHVDPRGHIGCTFALADQIVVIVRCKKKRLTPPRVDPNVDTLVARVSPITVS